MATSWIVDINVMKGESWREIRQFTHYRDARMFAYSYMRKIDAHNTTPIVEGDFVTGWRFDEGTIDLRSN